MISDTLLKLAQNRIEQIQSDIISWKIDVKQHEVISICINSKRPIRVKDVQIDPHPNNSLKISGSEGVNQNSQPSSLLNGYEYIARWNEKNHYFLRIDFENSIDLASIEIYIDNKKEDADWIFDACASIKDKNGNVQEIAYDDGIEWDIAEKSQLEIKELLKNTSNRRAPNETFVIYKKIRNSVDETTAQNVENLLRGILGTHTLSPHGYQKKLETINKEKLIIGLSNIVKEIENHGYTIFASSGTLLGIIRNGSFIDYDDDVDFGVIMKGNTLEEAIASMKDFEQVLIKSKLLRVSLYQVDSPMLHWKLKYVNGVNIDVFPVWFDNDRIYAWPYCYGLAVRQDLVPIKKILLHNIEIPVPAKPEKFLELNYGPNWRIPDPAFHFNWAAAVKKFSKFATKIRDIRKKIKK